MKLNIHRQWFQIYSSAMLEMDESRILERIQKAEQAIRARLRELEAGIGRADDAEREERDIAYALGHLKRLQRFALPA